MKRLYSILMLLSLVVVSACEKSDNATMPDGIVYLNQPQIEVVEGGDPVILGADPLAFRSSVTVDLYFKDSQKPDYLDLVVMKNGDAKNVKVLKGEISSYPVTVELTGELLTDLFGADIEGGDSFDVGANYIEGGKTISAFPEGGGTPYGAGVGSQAGASPMVRFSAICAFHIDEFLGDGEFEVVTDPWGDFGVGTIVDVVKVDESTISITYPIAGFNPIVLDVNVVDNTVVVEKQELGHYGGDWIYSAVSVESAGGGLANYVDPCVGRIRINGSYTVAEGGFGSFVLELEKAQ